MTQDAPATSLLEFLTKANPSPIHPKPADRSLTSNANWIYPKQMIEWKDFTFDTLEQIYERRLILEARRARPLPQWPWISARTDCIIFDEKNTESLIHKWNQSIVEFALEAVAEDFRPSLWVSSSRPSPNQEVEQALNAGSKRKLPPRKVAKQAKRARKIRLAHQSDSGAIAWDGPSYEDGCRPSEKAEERFPKEYKPMSKWTSDMVFHGGLTNDDGKWEEGFEEKEVARPIGQAYTYCVSHGCRYGCILSCGEAFIFRIKPLLGSRVDDPVANKKKLKQCFLTDGLMEYITIPWNSHRTGPVDRHRTWTVNLALWFVHILAGNAHATDWCYGSLADETLSGQRNDVQSPSVFETPDAIEDDRGSDDTPPTELTETSPLSGKQNISSEELDPIHLSFSEHHQTL